MRLQKLGFMLTTALFIFLFYSNSYSQDPPIEWGVIPRSDLEMKSFPADSNASAVILCDYGQSNFNNSLNIVFERIVRIKILNKNGYKLGSFAIGIHSGDGDEHISDIEGITYSLNDKGKVVKNELDDDQVFNEDVDGDYTLYKFTMPGLKPGCIIEVRYNITSTNFMWMQDWTFQWSEPVEWSEYRACFPQQIIYTALTMGYEIFYRAERTNVYKLFMDDAAYYLGTNNVPCIKWRWIIRNAPAIREVPYMTTPDDYKEKVSLQLAGYSLVGTGVHSVLRDWTVLSNKLLDSDYFGKRIDVTGDVEDLEKKIDAGLTSPEDKVKAIYNWVKNSIVWNGENRFDTGTDVDDVIESKKGTSADINFLLLSLLKCAGIKADPVILSTRSNGRIQQIYPILTQFNYTVTRVTLGNKVTFLDATNPLRPIELLPSKILGTKALIVKKDTTQWVFLSPTKPDRRITGVEINLNKDGSMTGKYNGQVKGYGALNLREDISGTKDNKEFAKDFYNTDSKSLTVDSAKVLNVDSLEKAPEIDAWVSSPDFAQQNGDMLYLNPQILKVLEKNPLISKERKFPLDFTYTKNYMVILNIIFPPDYEVKDTLKNKFYRFGDRGTTFSRGMTVNGNIVQIMTKLVINETTVKSDYYEQLKAFFSQIIQCESEELVLEKKKEPAKSDLSTQTESPLQKPLNNVKNLKHAKKKT